MPTPQSISVVDGPASGWSRLLLAGHVTVSSASQLHEAALRLAASGNNVTVCCAGAEYLDASAIQILISLGRDLVRRGKRCDITNVPDGVKPWFRLAGLGTGS
jgi:anti-anti-sigma regulatory factor